MTTFFTDLDIVPNEFDEVSPIPTVGEEFTFGTAGTAVVRWFWPSVSPTVTPVANVWNAANGLVAGPLSFATSTLGAWNVCSSVVTISVAGTYRFAVTTNRYRANTTFHSGGPVVRGAITGVQGRFGPPGVAPASTSNAAYFVDVDWTPTGGGSDLTASATFTASASLAGSAQLSTSRTVSFTASASLAGQAGGGATSAQEVIGMGAVYTTRERVMRASDIKASAYRNAEVDAAIESASRAVDALTRRGDALRPGFAPWTGTITFDWQSVERGNIGSSFRLWLSPHALAAQPTAATSGGTSITANAYGWPVESGAPYPALSVDRNSASTLQPGNAAGQRSTAVTGVWCACLPEERGRTNWTLGASVTSSTGTLTVNAPFEVGQILRIGDERLIVNDRLWATSGQTGTLAANNAAQSLAVTDGTVFFPGEELILDAERVWVRDVVGNTLIVQRAVSGSILAAHASVAIQWSRTALCERGALGTTAAAHTSGDRVWFHKVPLLIEQLATAYAIVQRAQETSAYARTTGSGDNERQATERGLTNLEQRVLAAYGRQIKHRAV